MVWREHRSVSRVITQDFANNVFGALNAQMMQQDRKNVSENFYDKVSRSKSLNVPHWYLSLV